MSRLDELAGLPCRVQLSRRRGWRMPPNTVKVDRSTRYGNSFIMAHEGTRALAVASYREQVQAQAEYGPSFYEPLVGKNLACWCGLCDRHKAGKPLNEECADCKPCHVDVLGPVVLGLAAALRAREVGE